MDGGGRRGSPPVPNPGPNSGGRRMGARGMQLLDAEVRGVRVQRARDAGEEPVRGELLQGPELHGENAVV